MNKKIVILGGGPAGLLLARLLSNRNDGSEIHVYERAQELEKRQNEKSFSFAIFERGFRALAEVPGLDNRVRERAVTIKRRSLNSLPEEIRQSDVASPFSLCQRDELIAALIQSIQEIDSERVHLHFGKSCTKVDFANRELHFGQDGEPDRSVIYDMLFAADGASSIVRGALESQYGYACEDKPYAVAYRNFYLNQEAVEKLEMGYNEFHGWRMPDMQMIMAVPQPDGTATCNLLFPLDSPGASSAELHWKLMEEHCPGLAEVIPEEERKAFLERPMLTTRTIKMECYHFEDHVCLLGDAAHAVPPSIGQGCNSAMEDSAMLARLLDDFGSDRAGALEAFTKERVPEMHALLALSNMPARPEAKFKPQSTDGASSKAGAPTNTSKKPPFNMIEYLSTSKKSFSQVLKEQLEGTLET